MGLAYLEHSASNLIRVLSSIRARRHIAYIDVSEKPKLFKDIAGMEEWISKPGLMLLGHMVSRKSLLGEIGIAAFN
ncbi:hypothetical protein UNDKW_3148 [Undibacterium sp. KW1]|uniref:hypothetical protein n=1 Tax=Undibacterium sp. KW1 TaxID=2058624 RepID=UPI001331FBE9|nr:hypothetical protein [Undibacterium sp. KW1]BBB61421.1 hypothetical protein UNDKW_3148 [Undibacterium sp. KW1]